MKLTISMKNSLVAAIFGDVPKVYYAIEIEQIIRKTAFDVLSPEIRALPEDVFRAFVALESYWDPETEQCFCLPTDNRELTFKILRVRLKENPRFMELCALHNAQRDNRHGIEAEIRQAINSCNTDKQLLARYPEFAKYLPTQKELSNLPTVPIIEHLKAAGWKE